MPSSADLVPEQYNPYSHIQFSTKDIWNIPKGKFKVGDKVRIRKEVKHLYPGDADKVWTIEKVFNTKSGTQVFQMKEMDEGQKISELWLALDGFFGESVELNVNSFRYLQQAGRGTRVSAPVQVDRYSLPEVIGRKFRR